MPNGTKSGKLTRRQWAAALGSAAALTSAAGLTSGAEQAQTPQQPAPSPEAELQAARDQVKANVTALLEIEVPMTTEPAFQFKA